MQVINFKGTEKYAGSMKSLFPVRFEPFKQIHISKNQKMTNGTSSHVIGRLMQLIVRKI